jgi:hypothetical protein
VLAFKHRPMPAGNVLSGAFCIAAIMFCISVGLQTLTPRLIATQPHNSPSTLSEGGAREQPRRLPQPAASTRLLRLRICIKIELPTE